MIYALITVYYPAAGVVDHVRSIASQVDAVYICDNSPVSNEKLFDNIAKGNVQYKGFQKNVGLSCAFNRVLKDSQIPWHDDDYIFFFDQDSVIAENHISQMISVYESLQRQGFNVGCLGPAYFNTSSNTLEMPKAKKELMDKTYSVSSIITSSMLCNYRNLHCIDFFNEHVFLDMADWDLCWRIQQAGQLCCITESVVFRHSVGSGEKKIGLLKLRVGQPFREYYQIRESLYLFGKSYTPLKYKIRFLAMLFIRSPLHVLFLDQRKQRAQYIIRGLMDFIRNKEGSLESS